MYRYLWAGVLAVAALVVAQPGAQAAPIPAGWSCTGNCGTLGPDGVVTAPPAFGPDYQYISTSGGSSGAGQISSVGGTNGSELVTNTFSANAGDLLDFYFNYVTSDGSGFSDYSWAELRDSSNAHVAWLFTARTQPTGDTSPGFGLPSNDSTLIPPTTPIIPGGPVWSPLGSWSGACYAAGCGYTDWIQSQYTIGTSGNYILAFGVTNWADQIYDSGLAIAGVTIGGVPITPAPEPGSLVLLGSALLGLGFFYRRRRQS